MSQNGSSKGLRRTKSLRLVIERLLPFLGDIGKPPRYDGSGYWKVYGLTGRPYRKPTIKVFRSLPWAIAISHPDPEAAKSAARWYGDVDEVARLTVLHWSYESALRWFTLREEWDDFPREHVQGVGSKVDGVWTLHERTPTELFKRADKRYNLRTGAAR
jgi:hypothetical protein|tara:strand:+ start:5096 stop:5572 length:477 start_codon:yes stop_codon:yes gene_type:complete